MKLTRLIGFTFGLFSAMAAWAEDSSAAGEEEAKPEVAAAPIVKTMAPSPDGDFAMRVRYEPTSGPTAGGMPGTVLAVDLIATPSGKVAATLMPYEASGVNFRELELVWSSDSNWAAFYYAYPRVGYTTVLRRQGDKFVEFAQPKQLMTDAGEGLDHIRGVRNEFVSPVKWTKPGTLELRQFSILRTRSGRSVGVKYDLTAVMGSKKGEIKNLTAVRQEAE